MRKCNNNKELKDNPLYFIKVRHVYSSNNNKELKVERMFFCSHWAYWGYVITIKN